MPIHDDPFQPNGEKRSREDRGGASRRSHFTEILKRKNSINQGQRYMIISNFMCLIHNIVKFFKIKEQLKLIVDLDLIKSKWLDYQHIN